MILNVNIKNTNSILIGFVPILFYFFSHMSFLADNVKQMLLVLSIALNIIILFFIFFIDLISNKVVKKSSLLLLLIGIYIYVHSFLFPSMYEYGQNKITYLFIVLFLVLCVTYLSFRNAKSTLSLIYFLMFFSLFFCFLSMFLPMDENNLRKSSIGLNPTIMSKACLVLSVFSTSKLLTTKNLKSNSINILLLLISFVAIFKTGSRGVIISYIVSLIALYYLINGATRSFKIILFFPVLLVFFYFMLGMLPEELASRYSLEAMSIEENSDEGDRIQLWGLALFIINNNFWGIGAGNFLDYSFIAVPHNIFLEIAVDFGVIPSLIIFTLILYAFIKMKDSITKYRNFSNTFFSFLFMTQILNSLLGNELSIQSFLLYICIIYFAFSYYKLQRI